MKNFLCLLFFKIPGIPLVVAIYVVVPFLAIAEQSCFRSYYYGSFC